MPSDQFVKSIKIEYFWEDRSIHIHQNNQVICIDFEEQNAISRFIQDKRIEEQE